MNKSITFNAFLLLSACSQAIDVSENEVETAIQKSDDFVLHNNAFIKATVSLVRSGQCTTGELAELGGWMKSVINHKTEPVYFTYCGGMNRSNRIYLNVETQQTFTD